MFDVWYTLSRSYHRWCIGRHREDAGGGDGTLAQGGKKAGIAKVGKPPKGCRRSKTKVAKRLKVADSV